MENRAHAFAVGLAALLLIGGILMTLWWFGGGGEEFRTYELETNKGVTGLNNQAAVRFRGVRVGRVMSIDLDDDDPYKVIVTIRVRKDVPMTHSTFAMLGFQGLTGNAFVLLDDTGKDKRPLLPKGQDPIRIELQPGLIEQASDTGRKIIGRLDEASKNFAQVLRPENVTRIDAMLKNLASSTEHLDQTLAQTPALIGDLRRIASPQTAEQLHTALAELTNASKKIAPAVENWNRALGKVEAAGSRIDRLGADLQASVVSDTLPRINALATELQGTSLQLSTLLDDVQRSPQSLLLGREALRLGPGETGEKNSKESR
ncbi:MAG: periplasmic component of ABC-type transport system [Rhodocyclales bacterium]|nr:periplasmic component of ABC-type transport system [Rhodocyclales bacterium]